MESPISINLKTLFSTSVAKIGRRTINELFAKKKRCVYSNQFVSSCLSTKQENFIQDLRTIIQVGILQSPEDGQSVLSRNVESKPVLFRTTHS